MDKQKRDTVTKQEIKEQYNKFIGRKILFIFLLLAIIVGISGFSITLGSADLTVWDAYSSILRKPFPDHFKPEFIFCWDNVPGSDGERFKQFLIDDSKDKHNINISWVGNALIHKSDDGKTIYIYNEDNAAEITLDKNRNEKDILKIIYGKDDPTVEKKKIELKITPIENKGKLNIHESPWLADTCIWELRLPRTLLGIVAGIGLAIGGAVMQAVLRNPLASPYTLGISAGAGFGASLAILAGAGLFADYLVIGNAFVFALLCSFVILGLASSKGATPETMVLAGIAMMYIFSAMTTLLKYFSESDAVKEVVFWMVGDLDTFSWEIIGIITLVLACCIPILMIKSWDLNVMGAGDETATSLGVNVKRTRILVMMVATIMVASIVSFTGTIGFIGLVAPHITRIFIGGDNRYVFPVSGLLGAVLLTGADIVARTVMAPVILPVGAVTACLGGPLFLYMIMKRRREYW